MDTQDAEDTKTYKPGELLSCDNVGPVNHLKSFEGYTRTLIWRDTATKRIFLQLDSEATEEVYLEGLKEIRLYYKARAIIIKVTRIDDFTTFSSLGWYGPTTPRTA